MKPFWQINSQATASKQARNTATEHRRVGGEETKTKKTRAAPRLLIYIYMYTFFFICTYAPTYHLHAALALDSTPTWYSSRILNFIRQVQGT